MPGWRHAIRKVECANNTVKCCRGALGKLVAEKLGYSGRGKLMAYASHAEMSDNCSLMCRQNAEHRLRRKACY